MKILLLVDDYMPDSIKVAAIMMHDLAVELQRQGHDVTVCTPDESLSDRLLIGEYGGVRTLRFRLGAIKNVPKVKRAINETLLSHNAWKNLKSYFKDNPHELIVYYSPTIFFGGLVKKLKLTWGCKSFLILRDFFPQWAVDNGLISEGSLIHRYFKYFEDINYNAATVIAVQSPSNMFYFQSNMQYDKYCHKLAVLYNWCDISNYIATKNDVRVSLGLEDKVIFFYGGNIGHAQDMMNIIRLAQSLKQFPEAHFLLLGKGDEVELILDYIQQNNLDNVTYLSSVSQKEYNEILIEIDIGLFSLHKSHKTHNFPGKLLGYMKAAKPILGSINKGNDLENVVLRANAGFISTNGDDAIFMNNAMKLLKSPAIRKEMGEQAYTLLNDMFSVNMAASKILGMCHT